MSKAHLQHNMKGYRNTFKDGNYVYLKEKGSHLEGMSVKMYVEKYHSKLCIVI